jgi:hypothetical protein
MCVYDDVEGWQNKQFLGRGEFALPFGDYKVRITVPADHIVASTGWLQNPKDVLTTTEQQRFEQAKKSFDKPVIIVTEAEAKQKEKTKSTAKKTWEYHAENVRDFAFASSRKFIWDAQAVKIGDKTPLAMSYYPKEGNPLWERESTKAVKNTLITYSKHTIDYPYPVAISVHAASIGMEYPMICFNYGRTDKEGNYSEAIKYGMIGVIIHEVGHNFFPMIINSDERNWSWMDEGLNTFVQFLTEQEFDNNYPSRRGPAHKIVDYMKLPAERLEPIMTNSENIIEFGPNAYGKPATALNILRETVMGRSLFDHAFKEYCRRWAFKHPRPEDFFRTMEDASGVDLDWFWRAWFYDIEPVDISLDSVLAYELSFPTQLQNKNQSISSENNPSDVPIKRKARPIEDDEFKHVSQIRNKEEGISFAVDLDTTLRDFYYYYRKADDSLYYQQLAEKKSKNTRTVYDGLELLDGDSWSVKGNYYYQLEMSNKGGAVSPVIIGWEFEDGSLEIDRISAYVWRKNEQHITKSFVKTKKVVRITLDPMRETADIDEENNRWPNQFKINRVEAYKLKQEASEDENPMKRYRNKKNK